MTREEILAMKPGRELDVLVAVEILGWYEKRESWYDEEGVEGTRFVSPDGEIEATYYGWDQEINFDMPGGCGEDLLPHYSTDIAAAWEVVENLTNKETWCSVRASTVLVDMDKSMVGCRIFYRDRQNDPTDEVIAKTAPEAICKAALLAILD